MKKILASIVATGLGVMSIAPSPTFSYTYRITANSNKVEDLLVLYEVKQDFIDRYNRIVLAVNENYHEQIIIDNLPNFIDPNIGIAKYEEQRIFIIIGEGQGSSIEGDLKSNICDSGAANYRIYILDLLFGNA